jgi:hypothetical protein
MTNTSEILPDMRSSADECIPAPATTIIRDAATCWNAPRASSLQPPAILLFVKRIVVSFRLIPVAYIQSGKLR